MTEFYLPSHGKGKIRCVQWEPEGQVRCIVQVVHGIAEHVLRYADFAKYLNEQGILVVGEDHMGHGGSIVETEPIGYFHGGWTAAVDDTYSLMLRIKSQYPKVPYVLFGHSMGSFMARTLLYRHPDSGISAAVICGTAWQPAPILKAGLAMCRSVCKLNGETKVSPKLRALIFGAYNKRIPDAKYPHEWISSVPEEIRSYGDDPLCGFAETAGLDRDMLFGIQMNQKKDNLSRMPMELPVLFIAGTDDPVGNYGKGVRQSAEAFRKAGMRSVDVKLYKDCRHDILHDTENDNVYSDILQWILSKI